MSTTVLASGRKTVTSAGTAERLTTIDTPVLWVTVAALTSNTSQVNVGPSVGSPGTELEFAL